MKYIIFFFQQQVARNQSLRREKSDVVVVSVQDGKITDAKNSFMQSMMTSSSSSSSSRLGTSILPAGLDGQVLLKQEQSSSSSVVHKTSSKKGKDLFKKCAERQEQNVESSMSSTFTTQESVSSLIPGVDFEVSRVLNELVKPFNIHPGGQKQNKASLKSF